MNALMFSTSTRLLTLLRTLCTLLQANLCADPPRFSVVIADMREFSAAAALPPSIAAAISSLSQRVVTLSLKRGGGSVVVYLAFLVSFIISFVALGRMSASCCRNHGSPQLQCCVYRQTLEIVFILTYMSAAFRCTSASEIASDD